MPKNPESKNLIAFLTAPLKKIAHHEQAQEVLAEVAESAEDRQVNVFPHFYKSLALLWLLAALAAGLVWNHYRKPAFEISFMDVGGFFSLPIFDPVAIGGENEAELWFLGVGKGTKLEQKLKLHQSDPDNPLYYRHYVEAYLNEHDSLPEGYAQTIQRIDPDNAYWAFLSATELTNKICEKLDRMGEYEPPKEVDGKRIYPLGTACAYEILDAAVLEQAIVRLEQGCALPENRTYTREHIARVDEIYERLDPDMTLLTSTTRLLHYYSQTSGWLRLKRVDQILGASLYQAAEQKDESQFHRLAKLRNAFLRQQSDQSDDLLVGALVYKAIANETALSLMHASEELDLEEEAKRYRGQAEQFNDLHNARRNRSREDEGGFSPKMGILHQQALPMLANQVEEPPSYDVVDFKAARMAEHEFASQWLTMVLAAILLVLTLPLFFARFLFSRPIRVGAIRAARLLQPADWLRVFGLGVALPVALHLLLTTLTPLGGRGYGIGGLGYAYPTLPLITLFISMWMASSLVFRSCLAKRLPLPPASKRQTLPYWIYLGLALAIYLFGYAWLSLTTGPYEMYAAPERFFTLLWIHGILLGLFAIWSLWIRVRGSHAERFRMLATSSALIPCLPVAMLCLSVLLPIHLAGEKRWMSKDCALLPDASKPDYGLYEGKVTEEAYREANAILFPEEQTKN